MGSHKWTDSDDVRFLKRRLISSVNFRATKSKMPRKECSAQWCPWGPSRMCTDVFLKLLKAAPFITCISQSKAYRKAKVMRYSWRFFHFAFLICEHSEVLYYSGMKSLRILSRNLINIRKFDSATSETWECAKYCYAIH